MYCHLLNLDDVIHWRRSNTRIKLANAGPGLNQLSGRMPNCSALHMPTMITELHLR